MKQTLKTSGFLDKKNLFICFVYGALVGYFGHYLDDIPTMIPLAVYPFLFFMCTHFMIFLGNAGAISLKLDMPLNEQQISNTIFILLISPIVGNFLGIFIGEEGNTFYEGAINACNKILLIHTYISTKIDFDLDYMVMLYLAMATIVGIIPSYFLLRGASLLTQILGAIGSGKEVNLKKSLKESSPNTNGFIFADTKGDLIE